MPLPKAQPLCWLRYEIALRAELENSILPQAEADAFAAERISKKDREIWKLCVDGYKERKIAEGTGCKTASAVHKRLAQTAEVYEDFAMAEYPRYLGKRDSK